MSNLPLTSEAQAADADRLCGRFAELVAGFAQLVDDIGHHRERVRAAGGTSSLPDTAHFGTALLTLRKLLKRASSA